VALRATVIIPTYNRPALLGRLLACLAVQDGDALLEVLVCDDGSSTDTQAAMAPFSDRIPGLMRLRQEDEGFRAGRARNMGIRAARGDILIFLDDDLSFCSDFVAEHVAAHRDARGHRIVLGFRRRTTVPPRSAVPTAEEMEGTDIDDRAELIGPVGEGIAGHPQPWFFVYSCNFSVPNEPGLVWFDESFEGWGMEDTELGYRLVRHGFEVVVRSAARVLHVEDPVPRDPFRAMERGLQPQYDSYVRNMVQFLDKYPDDDDLRAQLVPELRWYTWDGGHWVKNGHENDAQAVMQSVRDQRAERLARSEAAAG
jgi:glycosyltransferase involved in cell wall biosynthesis